MARMWKLPPAAIDAARHHHHSAGCEGESRQTVQCVEVANFLCSVKGATSVGLNLVEFPREAIAELSFTKEDVVVLAEDLDREMESNQSLFEV